jgi:hypothetical protein
MTRLRQVALGGIAAALMVTGAVSKSFAEEPGTFKNRLNGATIGLPLGALPPEGLYAGFEQAFLGWPGKGTGNQAPGLFLPAITGAVPLLWVPGWTFFGAKYSASVVQAFYSGIVSTKSPFNEPSTAANLAGYYAVTANTFFQPINLSWTLGGGWFAAVAFSFTAPDGSKYANTPNPDYWTFEPSLAISYINGPWVGSANMFYDINTASRGQCCLAPGAAFSIPAGTGVPPIPGNAANGYRSGDMFYLDAFLAYKWGKWEIGPVMYLEAQTTNDSPGGGITCAALAAGPTGQFCGKNFNLAFGGLIGYDFGPVDIQVWITDSVSRRDEIDGLDFWWRMGFKLWGPEAPAAKPLVAKN